MKNKGFDLLEWIIIMAIVSIFIALLINAYIKEHKNDKPKYIEQVQEYYR
jgi:competence protein ComGC